LDLEDDGDGKSTVEERDVKRKQVRIDYIHETHQIDSSQVFSGWYLLW